MLTNWTTYRQFVKNSPHCNIPSKTVYDVEIAAEITALYVSTSYEIKELTTIKYPKYTI